MSRPPAVLLLLAALVLLTLPSALPAQDKELKAKGQLKFGNHPYKMEAGKLYQIRVEGAGFTPNVTIRPGYFTNQTQLDMGDTFLAYFVPRDTREHRVFVLPNLGDDLGDGPLDYTLSIKPITLAAKPLLQEKGALAAGDPPYKSEDGAQSDGPHKAYTLKLKAKQMYVIDLERDKSAKEMDPYLFLEGPGGKVVARDDDGGLDSNARIIFQPRRDGDYRVIATCLGKTGAGGFTVTVRGTTQD